MPLSLSLSLFLISVFLSLPLYFPLSLCVAADFFPVGGFHLTATFLRYGRTNTTTLTVNFLPGTPPVVSLTWARDPLYVAFSKLNSPLEALRLTTALVGSNPQVGAGPLPLPLVLLSNGTAPDMGGRWGGGLRSYGRFCQRL